MRKELHSPAEVLQRLAKNVRELLRKRGLSARAVAESTELSNKTVSNIANAAHSVQLGNAVLVCNALGVPLWLMLTPGLPTEALADHALQKLLEDFLTADEAGRHAILRTASLEAHAAAAHRAA